MKALDFYRYLRSYLTIHISGGFNERFINLCNKNGITLWNISFKNGTMTANIYSKDFSALRPLCKKSGVKAKITSKKGLTFDWLRHRKRRGILIGAVFFAVFMLAMNMFVWEIEIIGSEKLHREEVLSTVKEVGLDYGTFTPLFNGNDAARKALNMFDGKVLWLTINIKGSKATIEIRDLEKSDESNNKTEPSNLIANFDGTLIQAQTYSGVQIANAGETVTEGEMLISGIYENEDGSVMYQQSEGCFTALHRRKIQNEYVTDVSFKSFATKQRLKKLFLFHLRIPLYFKINTYDMIQSYTRQLTFDEKILPVGITEGIVCERITATPIETESLYFIDRFSAEEYKKMKSTLVISTDYSLIKSENMLRISCDYQCIDYIGKEVPIIRENINF